MSTMESPSMSRVRDARAGLLLTHPFFGVLSLKIELQEDSSIPTFCVNTRTLRFNPTFADSLSNAEIKGVIAHEVMHLAMCHHARMGARDHGLWNQAADYAINPCLIEDGFALPAGGLNDPQYAGLSAEIIYTKLRDKEHQSGKQGPSGENSTGTFESAGPEDSAAAGEAAREWTQNAQEATRAASSAGKMPAHIKRQIAAAGAPKQDWRALLRRFMTDQVKQVPTWARPNKRFPDIYLPGKRREGMGAMAAMVDTSGSIYGNPGALERFSVELNAVVADVEPSAVYVVYCDTRVTRVDVFEAGEPITIKPEGGGGTMFTPAFDRVAAEGWPVACAVYFTDLECSDWPSDPGYPVLWASYGAHGAVAPMGETIQVD